MKTTKLDMINDLKWKIDLHVLRGSSKLVKIKLQEPRRFGFSRTIESSEIALDSNNVRFHEIIQEEQQRILNEYMTTN